MSKKEIHYQGLAELSVIVEDTSALSPDYFKVTHLPTELTAGLNTFKFKGQPSLFPENTDVYIEILDANGEPIYYEVNIDLESEEQPAIVSIFVTQDTTPGNGTIIICAGANQSAEGQILDPSEINVRWQVPIYIDISKRNEDAIIFSALPTISITASTGSYTNLGYSGNNRIVNTTWSNLSYIYKNDTPVLYTSSLSTALPATATNAIISILYGDIQDANQLSSKLIPSLTVFTSSIDSFNGDGIAYLKDPIIYPIYNSAEQHIVQSGVINTVSVSYEQSASLTPQLTQNTHNVAIATFLGLQPQVGEVAKIRSYYKSTGVGEYILSNETDISDLSDEFGFTSDIVTASFAIPTIHRNDHFDFKFEFVNPAGLVSKQVVEVRDVLFSGGNTYIGGDDNLMTGSLYVAGTTGTGVHISGKGAAAMIRSIGYNGFYRATHAGPGGFVIYSGSVQPLLDASESYSGVGIELVANSSSYFKYTTSGTGLLDIKTDTFFLGGTSQFISGSNGNIVISSSNFSINQTGNTSVSGDIIANNGLFKNVVISGQVISGSGTALSGSGTAYLLESWVTSSADRNLASGSSYSSITPRYETNNNFRFGIFGWTASAALEIAASNYQHNPLYPYNMAAVNYNRGYNFEGQIGNPGSPALFKQWSKIEGIYGPAYNGFGNEVTASIYGGTYACAPIVDTMMFVSSKTEYAITSSLITIPDSLLGTVYNSEGVVNNAFGIGLQFAARMISGSVNGTYSNWTEGLYEKYQCTCEILNSSGSALISETRYFKGNADWQQFNIPITAALITINNVGNIQISNQIKIRLSWQHGTPKPNSGKFTPYTAANLIRFTELRFVQYPRALGMQMSSLLFDDSYISSDVSGSQHEGNWNPVNTDIHDIGTNYKRWNDIYNVTTNSDYLKLNYGIINAGNPYDYLSEPNSLIVYDGASKFGINYNPALSINYDGDTTVNNSLYVGTNEFQGNDIFSSPPAQLNISGTLSYILPAQNSFFSVGDKLQEASGEIVVFGEYGSFNTGSIYYYSGSSTWELASARSEISGSGMLAISSDSYFPKMLIRGTARYSGSANYNKLTTPGQKIYLSTTPGKFQTWAPTGSGEIVRILGYCIDQLNTVSNLYYDSYDSTIYFMPDNTYLENI